MNDKLSTIKSIFYIRGYLNLDTETSQLNKHYHGDLFDDLYSKSDIELNVIHSYHQQLVSQAQMRAESFY